MVPSMTRKQFLVGTGAAGATLFAPFVARAAHPTIIKLGNDEPLGQSLTVYANKVATEIKKESNGEIEVQVFPNNQLGDDTHMLADVRAGALQMMQIGDNLIANLAPSAAIDNIGYAFSNPKIAFAALDGAVGDVVRADIIRHGLQPMSKIWDFGFRQITTRKKLINTPEDLNDLKIRVPNAPISISLIRDLGASPAPLNSAELYTALQTGVVDGETNTLGAIETAKYYQVQRYCSMTNHMWIGFWVVMNGPFWKRLPADHRKVIETTFNTIAVKQRINNEAVNNSLQPKLESQGLTFNTPDPAPFKAMLVKNGFYSIWQKKFGPALWSALEKYTGALA